MTFEKETFDGWRETYTTPGCLSPWEQSLFHVFLLYLLLHGKRGPFLGTKHMYLKKRLCLQGRCLLNSLSSFGHSQVGFVLRFRAHKKACEQATRRLIAPRQADREYRVYALFCVVFYFFIKNKVCCKEDEKGKIRMEDNILSFTGFTCRVLQGCLRQVAVHVIRHRRLETTRGNVFFIILRSTV